MGKTAYVDIAAVVEDAIAVLNTCKMTWREEESVAKPVCSIANERQLNAGREELERS